MNKTMTVLWRSLLWNSILVPIKTMQLLISGSPYAETEHRFPTNLAEWYTYHLVMIRYQMWTQSAEGKTLLTPRHSLNSFSAPRPSRTLELLEGSKNWLPILLEVVYTNWNWARQSSQLISPDRFSLLLVKGCSSSVGSLPGQQCYVVDLPPHDDQ